MTTNLFNSSVISKAKKEAENLKRSSEGQTTYSQGLEIASRDLGFNSWHALQHQSTKYVVVAHVYGSYLGKYDSNGWNRLKKDFRWSYVASVEEKPTPDDFYSTAYSTNKYLKHQFLQNSGLTCASSDFEFEDDFNYSIEDICGILATLTFRVFRSKIPDTPDINQFFHAISPLSEIRNANKKYEYIFLDNSGKFLLSPPRTTTDRTYCLKYNPEYAVHYNIASSTLFDTKLTKTRATSLYFNFIKSWVYHLKNRVPCIRQVVLPLSLN